ncbi:MAG: hypothetical protein IIZ40_02590 [Bacilli bacterium]|nr:hypothetical protein [Bacilli bacterium]
MKDTIIKSILPYLKGAKYIGKGKTAYCFLMRDNKVLKLFYKSIETKNMFDYFRNPINHFYELEKINNDTYIAPLELLIKDNELIGYIYDYIDGKTLKRVGLNFKIEELIEAYDRLEEDTRKISESKFALYDTHDKNIIFNGGFKVIDLDKGIFVDDEVENIYKYNMSEINQTIIHSIFNESRNKMLEFRNQKLRKEYLETVYSDPLKMKDLLKDISNTYNKKYMLLLNKNDIIKSRNKY